MTTVSGRKPRTSGAMRPLSPRISTRRVIESSTTSTTSTSGWAAWDDRTEAKGSKGIAIAVAAVNLGGLLALPAMLVVGIYTFVTVYAIVKAVGAGSDEANAIVVLLGVVGIVTLFVTMLGVGGWLVGRSADPKKRGR